MRMPAHDRLWRYGSIRILRDGRVRLSPLTFPAYRYLSFIATTHTVALERGARVVLFLTLSRNRLVTACFAYDIRPDELRELVSELRRVKHGLERWIVPALEFTSTGRTLREDNPETYAIIPELLERCRDLPVAEQWKRVRATVFASAAKAEAEALKADAAHPRPERTPRRPRPSAG